MLAVQHQISPSTWQWNHHAFRAMNTNIFTRLFSQTDDAVLLDVEHLFISFEKRLSRFLPTSELSRLNACPTETFSASPTLISAVEMALWLADITNGLYDPTILSRLEKAGYDRSFELISTPLPLSQGTLEAATPDNDQTSAPPFTYRSVQVDRPARRIHRPVGLKLDLGGMGKGWTVDRAADRLQGLGPFLVNAGGDIYAYQSPPGTRGWQIDLVHPLHPELSMAQVYLRHQALATSTIARRRWQQNGRAMHHLINPRTGLPAQTDALSVTAIADRTVLAEVFAKVALILGAEAGLDYLNRLPGVEGVIFTAQSTILYTDGMPPLLERVEPAGYAA
ncbi:MAG: FAD:protein FMN transferase [Chloroflexi bacterium]|nr:MAG: FAD:protein FMN transferase [Chloroflexota bacterium]